MSIRRLADHQPAAFAFTRENLARCEAEIAKYPKGRQQSAVIAMLWIAQEQEGWISEPCIRVVADMLGMPTIRVLEVATFYTMFHLHPSGKHQVLVCTTTPCWLRGSDAIVDVCKKRIHKEPHHVSEDGVFSWQEVECAGACVNAPQVQIGADYFEDLTAESFTRILDELRAGRVPRAGPQNGRHSSEPLGGPTTLKDVRG